MEKEYWLNKWQANDIHFHQSTINPYLMKFRKLLDLHTGSCILVPLCGKTKDIFWLADQGYKVIGVELSPIACEDFFREIDVDPEIIKGQNHLLYQHQNIQIYCGDIFDISRNDFPAINAIYDCRALVALPQDIRRKYVEHLFTLTGSVFHYFLITTESSFDVQGPPFSISAQEVNELFGQHGKIQQLERIINQKIPNNLIAKGYRDFIETAYLISSE